MRFQLNGLPLAVTVLACAGCVTADRSDTAQSTREIINLYQCSLEYEFAGGTMRASVVLNEDGSLVGQSPIRWERPGEGGFAPSAADARYRVLPPSYLLAWPVGEVGQLNPALGQLYVTRHVFPGDQAVPWPSHIRIGFRTSLDQPAFGNARFTTDPMERQGSIMFFTSLDEALALARGGGSLFGVVIADDGALMDYWPVDRARLEAARTEAPLAHARMEAIARNYEEECAFIEDVEANRIRVTGRSQFRAQKLSAGSSRSRKSWALSR